MENPVESFSVEELEKLISKSQEILEKKKARATSASDEVVEAADKVMTFLEENVYAMRSEIHKACWRYVDADLLDVILRTFVQAGLVLEVQETRSKKIFYVDRTTRLLKQKKEKEKEEAKPNA